ncbi:hypothetical protein PVL29_003584 [Vitis rotundifolia]|uniref:Uncharacterized protein n=1 Tax=Vitis rotundifolia TaxID=103349 RepID=A0AA39AG13_VITRO|nr:hypothetical protein PVL29_003584 [Vitis rotundifolia]
MGSPKKNESKGFFTTMTSGLSMFSNAMHRFVNCMLGYEGVEFIIPKGGKEDAKEEAQRGRWKQEKRDSYWKMMHKYIGSDVTLMVTLLVLIFEPMTMLQKMTELMEYSHLLDKVDEYEDPYMRLVYASLWAISQVSHHPPMSVGHAENEHFTYEVKSKLKTKFLGNSLYVYHIGRTRVTLKIDGVVLDLVPPPTKVNNLIFRRIWVVLYFQPCGWFGVGRYKVDGYVYNFGNSSKDLMDTKSRLLEEKRREKYRFSRLKC